MSVSAISNSSESSTSCVSSISMATEALTCGERMGGPGDKAGLAVALNSTPCCGDIEVAEGAVTLDRSSMTSNDLDVATIFSLRIIYISKF